MLFRQQNLLGFANQIFVIAKSDPGMGLLQRNPTGFADLLLLTDHVIVSGVSQKIDHLLFDIWLSVLSVRPMKEIQFLLFLT